MEWKHIFDEKYETDEKEDALTLRLGAYGKNTHCEYRQLKIHPCSMEWKHIFDEKDALTLRLHESLRQDAMPGNKLDIQLWQQTLTASSE